MVGSAPAGQELSIDLPLRGDRAGLARFAAAVSTPGSSDYGQYESVGELARRFGASASVRTHTLAYLRRVGASGVTIDVTGLFADATMPVALAERLFGTRLATFRSDGVRADTAGFTAPLVSPTLPAGLIGDATGVVGLDTQPLSPGGSESPESAAAIRSAVGTSASADSAPDGSAQRRRSGTAAGCARGVARTTGFTPNQYLTAYGYADLHQAGIDGQGERVALIEIDGFRPSDIRTFAKCFGLRVPNVSAYGVGVKRPLPPGGESTLDLELLDAAAPDLREVDVYESESHAADVLRSLTDPLRNSGHRPNVISASLGACELATEAAIGASGIRDGGVLTAARRRERDLRPRFQRRRRLDRVRGPQGATARPAVGQLPGLLAMGDRRGRHPGDAELRQPDR